MKTRARLRTGQGSAREPNSSAGATRERLARAMIGLLEAGVSQANLFWAAIPRERTQISSRLSLLRGQELTTQDAQMALRPCPRRSLVPARSQGPLPCRRLKIQQHLTASHCRRKGPLPDRCCMAGTPSTRTTRYQCMYVQGDRG